MPPPDPLEREDCLFLDVLAPREVFHGRKKKKAPVMVWFYGGGYAFGRKGLDGNPSGLLERSKEVDAEGRGVIFVTFNYRVRFLLPFSIPSTNMARAELLGSYPAPT